MSKVNIAQAKKIVIKAISDVLKGEIKISEDMQLIGGESLLLRCLRFFMWMIGQKLIRVVKAYPITLQESFK
jgi:hypothetical protein